jgi:hypothetical protein
MYWSPRRYPSLVGLSQAERHAILRSALNEHRRGYGVRYIVVVAAISALGILTVSSRLGAWLAAAPPSDWRKWVPLALVGALIYGAYLWEVNGPMHTAVKKYFADRNA